MSSPARAPLELTSTANPRVKSLIALRRRRSREESRLTLVEGYPEIGLALAAGCRPQALYYCPELRQGRDDEGLAQRCAQAGADVFRLSRPVFEKVAYRESPDGWLAVVPSVATDLGSLQLGPDPLLLIGESIEKPGNLGAMLRTADAAGAAAVITADPVADWGNPNLVRASKGTVFSVPVASAAGPDLLRWLKDRSITVVATTPDTDRPFTDLDYRGPVAIVVGAEDQGLSTLWLEQCDATVTIPMWGRVNSINVATSAALVLYEAVRQRHLTAPPAMGGNHPRRT
ncbi:MAG TPA: RNA methyltransferase [Micromonosporaceae bacterium]